MPQSVSRDMARDLGQIDAARWAARARSSRCATSDRRSSIRRFMRSAWLRIRPRNFSRALASFLGRALERFDEARERGERGAQFMAGIGDEIGAHAFDLLFAGEVARAMTSGAAMRSADQATQRPRSCAAAERAFRSRRGRRLAAADGGHRFENGGRADGRSEVLARRIASSISRAGSLATITMPSAVQHQTGSGSARRRCEERRYQPALPAALGRVRCAVPLLKGHNSARIDGSDRIACNCTAAMTDLRPGTRAA